jgi:hypothetical protein
MTAAYEATLATTSQRLLNASIGVASNMAQSQHIHSETLWEIQTEVCWTLLSALLRGIYSIETGGREMRNDIQDDLVPILVNDILDASFDWPPNSEGMREAQYDSLLAWIDKSEADNGATPRFMSVETSFFRMMFDGSIPNDSLVGKLCGRVARATGEEGNSELIQALFLQTAEAHMKADIHGLTIALVEAKRAA